MTCNFMHGCLLDRHKHFRMLPYHCSAFSWLSFEHFVHATPDTYCILICNLFSPDPHSTLLCPLSRSLRYQLITPLHSRQFEKPVLVNRGWVPATWRSDAEFRHQWESKGSDATLQVVTRVSEDPSTFVPQNNPKTGEWFWIDVPAMAVSLDLPSDTPLVEVGLLISLHCPGTSFPTDACRK